MKILVTGAAGFIGSHLCESLIKRGDTVIGVDSFDPFYSKQIKLRNIYEIEKTLLRYSGKFKFVEANILDSFNSIFNENGIPDAICHLAAKAGVRPSIEDPVGYQVTNVVGTTRLLEVAKKYKINNFVFASSSSIYGEGAYNGLAMQEWDENVSNNPISPYAASKRSCELIGHTYSNLTNINFAALRYFTVYGPRQRPEMAIHKFLRKSINGEKITLYGNPNNTERDYTYINDIIDGTIAAIDFQHNIKTTTCGQFNSFNLGGGQPVKLKYLIDIIEVLLEKDLDIDVIERQDGDVLRTISDINKAKTILKYNPSVPIERGVEFFIDWINKQIKENAYYEFDE